MVEYNILFIGSAFLFVFNCSLSIIAGNTKSNKYGFALVSLVYLGLGIGGFIWNILHSKPLSDCGSEIFNPLIFLIIGCFINIAIWGISNLFYHIHHLNMKFWKEIMKMFKT